MLFSRHIAVTLIGLPLCFGQSSSVQPCALLASQSGTVYAQTVENCLQSVPINKQDALAMIDGYRSLLNWQSTIDILKKPPSDYQFPALDLVGELSKLRDQVNSNVIRNEIAFQRNFSALISRARDGHLTWQMDAMNVFAFRSPFGALSVASLDGVQDAAIYLYSEISAYGLGRGRTPSAVTTINGIKAADWILDQTNGPVYGNFQDKDALFNAFMYQSNQGGTAYDLPGQFAYIPGVYRGSSTTLGFANGTTITLNNTATIEKSLLGVVDGPSFALKFCNSTAKLQRFLASPSATASLNPRSTHSNERRADVTQLRNYPKPTMISTDGSLSGYFLNTTGFEDTAVLLIGEFPFAPAATSFQSVLTQFLNACRAQKKKHLIIDVTNNGGGAVMLVYEVFKQLFPNIEPYHAGNYRAQDTLDAIGKIVTPKAQKTNQQYLNNTAYKAAGGDSYFDARSVLNASGSPFKTWAEFYGPVSAQGDKFTNLFRWNISDRGFMGLDLPAVSGTNGKPLGPQPFEPQNMIIVGDGKCSSSCTTLSHLLKWQGKVRSIAIGGRPQTGPMQLMGGVKGSQVGYAADLANTAIKILTADETQSLANTSSVAFATNFQVMSLRTESNGEDMHDLPFNVKNNIAEGDATVKPLQFVYEAADCRLWNRAAWIASPSARWYTVAQQAFGLNGTATWSGCVKDSTKHPSSLSGNDKLYNNGVPNNVTTFASTSSGSGGDGSGSGNGGGRLTSSTALALIIAAFTATVAL